MFAKDQDRVAVLKALCIAAGVLLLMLIVGTFADLKLTSSVYVAEQPVAQLISAIGLLPLALPLCLLFGVLAQRIWKGRSAFAVKVISCVALAAGAWYASFFMTKSFFRYDGIGPLLPFEMPTVGSVVVGLAIAAGLMAVGYFSAQKNQEAALLRRTVLVVLLLAGSYFFVELIKGLMHRPRYRALVLGYEGLEFTPWFKPFHGAKELQETYSLASDEFKSFPSGHSVQVGATAISFYGLAALYPALRRKWKLALILEVVLLVCVLPCRLVLGAHFLSDVAVGALVSVVAGIFLYARRD